MAEEIWEYQRGSASLVHGGENNSPIPSFFSPLSLSVDPRFGPYRQDKTDVIITDPNVPGGVKTAGSIPFLKSVAGGGGGIIFIIALLFILGRK